MATGNPEVINMNKDYTVQQAAEELGLSEGRIRQLCISGDILADKFGKSWRIKGRDLKAFAKRERPVGNPNLTKSA